MGFLALAAVTLAAGGLPGPPHYRPCGVLAVRGAHVHPYVSHETCALAAKVIERCLGNTKTAECFGVFAQPYDGHGQPPLPFAPSFYPFGFSCWIVFPPYTAGLPPPKPTTKPGDEHPVLCERQSFLGVIAFWG